MKPSQFKKLIKTRIENDIKRPLLVESSSGLGKTQICAQVVEEINSAIDDKSKHYGFRALHAPLMQPEDYGMPVIGKDRDSLKFVVSAEKFPIEGSDCPDKGVLLIDELSQADNASQKILANLLQEREIHGYKIKAGWTIVATGNRVKDRAGANRLLSHLANKLTRVELEPHLDDWTDWALENDVPMELVSFIRFRPDLLSNFDPQNEINATPRAWAEGVASSLGKIPRDLEFESFKGDVGEGPASEFMAFYKVFRELPNIDNIFLNPMKEKVSQDPATQYAVTGALISRATERNFGKAMKYILRMPPEFSVLFAKACVTKNREISNTKDYIDWITKEGQEILN